MRPDRTTLLACLFAAVAAVAAPIPALVAQAPAARTSLTLQEALDIAERNNPTYLQSVTARATSRAGVRAAYGALLPSVSADMSAGLREGRVQYFQGVPFGSTSDTRSGSWGLSARAQYGWSTFTGIRGAGSGLDAAEADLEAAKYGLRAQVSGQFLLAMQTQARASFQDTLVSQQRLQLELARARAGVGAGTSLDVKRAEVSLGQQEVAALRAHNTADVEILRLFQQLGVAMPEGVQLQANLPIAAPSFELNALLDEARRHNPELLAATARQRAAAANLGSARGQYAPSVSLSASIGGSKSAPVDSAWPGKYTPNPYNLSASISLPIFDGLAREERLQQASAARENATYAVRRQELTLTAEVTSAWVTLQAAYRSVELQQRTAATAREALDLAEERYRVGSSTFVDLTTARAEYERAETDRIDAVYEYHRAFAALESAVGRTLR